MKCLKIILLTVITSMIGQFGFTQKVKTITLDFAEKSISLDSVKKIKHGELYKVQIENINVNLYDISINKNDSIITSNVTFPTLDLLGFDDINKVIGSITKTTFSEMGELIDKKNTIEYALISKRAELKSRESQLDESIQSLNSLQSEKVFISDELFNRDSTLLGAKIQKLGLDVTLNKQELSILEKDLMLLDAMLLDIYLLIEKEEPKTRVLNKIEYFKKEIESSLKLSKPFINEMNKLINNTNLQVLSYIESLYDKPNVSVILQEVEKKSVREIVEESKVIRVGLEEQKKNIEKVEKEYTDFKKIYKDLFEKNEDVKKQDIGLISNMTEAKNVIDKEIEKISELKVTEYLTGIIHLENNNGRSYTSLPLQHNGDISQLTITITPKKPEYGQSYTTHYEFPKRRFYAGIGGSFYYGNSFRNDVYSVQALKTTDTTSQFFIVNEEEKKGEVGFATLLHVGGKICKDWLGLHGTVGPAISLYSKPQFRAALGFGISIGQKKNMVSFDFLGMMGNVQRRSNVYHEDIPYSVKPEQISISKLSSSFAFSVGYIYRF